MIKNKNKRNTEKFSLKKSEKKKISQFPNKTLAINL